jgi:hypothetical protein
MGYRKTRTKRRTLAPKVPCAYCGRREAVETDHVPPQALFAESDKPLLIRVPACSLCNRGASKDEEFLIWVITVSAKANGPAWKAACARRFVQPAPMRHRMMATRLMATMRPVPVYSPAGIYLGTDDGYDPHLERVNRALNKVARGLYFHETGTRVPDSHHVEALAEPAPGWFREPAIQAILSNPLRVVVPDGFEYCFARAGEASAGMVMRFFRGVTAVAFVTDIGREQELAGRTAKQA